MEMNALPNGLVELVPAESRPWNGHLPALPELNGHAASSRTFRGTMEFLRQCAWEIGEKRPAEAYTPPVNHVGLAMVLPYQGFAHWRIRPEWVDQAARTKGDAWHHCRLVLRLYDVSFIEFNGLNAHSLQDHTLPSLCGQMTFRLGRPGTSQLGEVGFLLRNGEFMPAARSQAVAFAPDAPSPRGGHGALLVDERRRVEEIGNVWEQERILRERRQPRLRKHLRIASFALGSQITGQEGAPARFVSELAAAQSAQGHEVHVFVPATGQFSTPRQVDGVHYQPLDMHANGVPLTMARSFAEAVEQRLRQEREFDLYHFHEWMAGTAARPGSRPAILSLTSLETVRRNGTPPSALSLEIQRTERALSQSIGCILTPEWLRDKAVGELGIGGDRVRAFPMEGRMPNEWECPLDYGQVKKEIGVGPLDRMILFVGPVEHAAGVDLLVEALPCLLQRWSNLRLVYAGAGPMHAHLHHRAHQLGVGHAVRLLGHVEGPQVTRLVRSAHALILPSRCRVPFDDAVVDLARRAGRPVITTQGGPAHLVRHEENGILTYDNPGSMVWAVDRVLGDPDHGERMGRNGKRSDGSTLSWGEVARHYFEVCAACFPELTETQ